MKSFKSVRFLLHSTAIYTFELNLNRATQILNFTSRSFPKQINPVLNFSTCKILFFAKKKITFKNEFTFENDFKKQFSPKTSKERFTSADMLLNYDPKDQKRIYADSVSSSKPRKDKKQMLPVLTYRGEIVYGVHPVYLALSQKKRSLHQLFIRKEENTVLEDALEKKREIISMADSSNVPVSFVDSKGLKILAPNSVHQGVCLDAGFLPIKTWIQDDLDNPILEKQHLLLVLDEILDPMNVGAIIRSAYYFGVDKIFTVLGNSCKLSPTVSKASSGALEVVDLYQLENLENFILDRKSKDWSIVSTVAYSENELESDKQPIKATDFNITKPTVLILGNEGKGVSKVIQNLCDAFISIEPRQGLSPGIDSLNVSVAAGILLHVLTSKNLRT